MSFSWVHGELIGMGNKQTNPTSENLPKWNLLNLLRAVPELDTESSSVTALPLFLFCRSSSRTSESLAAVYGCRVKD